MNDQQIPAPTTRPSPSISFWRTLIAFQRDKLNFWVALRNTAGVVVPLIVGVALGSTPAGLALATGALNVAFRDIPSSYRDRARHMIQASILVAFAVFFGAICGHDTVSAVIVGILWAFATGMLVAISTPAADLGNTSLVILIVYMAVPQTFDRAVYAGLLAFGGGIFQTLLSLALWPLQPYIFERRALAKLFLELARAAESDVEVYRSPPASAQSTEAQTSLANLMTDRSLEAERYRMLLSEAERMRLGIMSLGRLRVRLQRKHRPEAAGVKRFLEIGASILRVIGQSLDVGRPAVPDTELRAELRSLPETLRQAEEGADLTSALVREARVQMDALMGQLRNAIDLTTSTSLEGFAEFERTEKKRPWRLQLAAPIATLRANLTLRSAACRHAIRLAVCIGVGEALARSLQLTRPYWMPMTIAIVLKPDFTSTFSRSVLRVVGTFIGLVAITGIFHVLPLSTNVEIALIAVSMFVVRFAGPANYGILAVGITALVVMLVAMTGVDPWPVMVARALNTVYGGAIALIAYGLWPTWERTQAPEAMARMLDAYRDYFRAIRVSFENPETSFDDLLDRTRLAARLARSNVEASIDRLCGEPGTSQQTIHMLSGILASSHRMVHAIMALEAGLQSSRPVPARPAFHRFATDVELTLYYLASALRGSPLKPEQLPDLREDHHALVHSGDPNQERYAIVNVETDRITNSLNTLSAELLQWIR